MRKITAQISLAPTDLKYSEVLLPRQVRQLGWADEVLLVIDEHRSRGRFGADSNWEQSRTKLRGLCTSLAVEIPNLRVEIVDYGLMNKVAEYFSEAESLPAKDYRGGPFYSYWYGLWAATNDIVLHIDSDIILSGNLREWSGEAIAVLRDPTVFSCSPLPGPPLREGMKIRQRGVMTAPGMFRFKTFSSRLFLLSKAGLKGKVQVRLTRIPLRRIRGWICRHIPYEVPEVLLADVMKKEGKNRIDFLGSGRAWSLHPRKKDPEFCANLHRVLARIDSGDIPEKQFGRYDLIRVADYLSDFSATNGRISQSERLGPNTDCL